MPTRSSVQPVPSHDESVERQLSMVVLTQLRDSLSLVNSGMSKLNDNMDRMNGKVDDVKERVISIEARDVEKELETFKIENAKVVSDLKDKVLALQISLARYQGLFIPLSIFGTGMLSALAVMFITIIFKGRP